MTDGGLRRSRCGWRVASSGGERAEAIRLSSIAPAKCSAMMNPARAVS
jgi:hypothetical protein